MTGVGRGNRLLRAKRSYINEPDLIEQNALKLAVLGARDNGAEIGMVLKAKPGSAAAAIRFYAEALDKIYGQIVPTPDNILGMINKEPVDMIGAIIPWNFPMMIGAWKLGPALAMGNSVVLKPSETAPLLQLQHYIFWFLSFATHSLVLI